MHELVAASSAAAHSLREEMDGDDSYVSEGVHGNGAGGTAGKRKEDDRVPKRGYRACVSVARELRDAAWCVATAGRWCCFRIPGSDIRPARSGPPHPLCCC